MARYVKSPTQDFLEIEEVLADMLITRNGTFAVIIKTNAVNFELLSPEEQELKIKNFASFINSLDFDLQILIETQKVSLHKYAEYIEQLENPTLSPGLQRQLKIYKRFIRKLVTTQNILDKQFYLVIPYRTAVTYTSTLPVARKKVLIEQALNFLIPKRNHVLKMLNIMGLNGKQLTTAEIIKYFLKIYNPGIKKIKFESTSIDV